jgi:hypothetical protein
MMAVGYSTDQARTSTATCAMKSGRFSLSQVTDKLNKETGSGT